MSCYVLLNQRYMCEGIKKISSSFTLHLKRFKKKASSDLKTILKTDFANLRFLELCLRQSLSINLNYIAWEKRLKLTWSKKKNHLCLKLYFIWYYFSRKRYPFRIPSIDEWYPFNIPCLELSSLLTAVKTLSFE